MNRISLVVAVVGVVICLIGVGLFVAGEDKFGSLEESQQYEGIDGEMKLEGYAGGGWLIVTMEGNYSHGESAIIDGGASLNQEDCDLINNFTLTGEDSEEYFIPTCDNRDDTNEDGLIHIGVICDSKGKYSNQTKGCPDGTYTWDTNGRLINVWDGEAIIEGLEGLAAFVAAFFACCCGVVVLISGIILAFVLQDEDTSQYYQSNTETGSSTTSGTKGWDEQADYIHKEKKEEDVPEKSEMATSEPEENKEEKKRSGEYELPPPPEY